MQAIFLEHFIEVCPIASGELGSARDIAAGELQDILQVGFLKLFLRLSQRFQRRVRGYPHRGQEVRCNHVLARHD